MREHEQKWSDFVSAVFSAESAMRSDDMGVKMMVVSNLQSHLEDLQSACERDDEE